MAPKHQHSNLPRPISGARDWIVRKNKGTFQRCYSKSIKTNNYSYGIEKNNYENIVGESRHVSGHGVSSSNYSHIYLPPSGNVVEQPSPNMLRALFPLGISNTQIFIQNILQLNGRIYPILIQRIYKQLEGNVTVIVHVLYCYTAL